MRGQSLCKIMPKSVSFFGVHSTYRTFAQVPMTNFVKLWRHFISSVLLYVAG